MFRQLHNIDSAFRHVRLFSLFFLLGCLLLSGWAIWKSYELVALSREQIYVLTGAQANPARLSRRENNIPVEARDHIRMFHHWFFTIDPDEEVIREHMSRALALADGSAKSAYDNLREKGYYSGIISANISQEVEIDSITLTGDA
ncbi:MAG: conjugative transposon protein TraK, partial [Mucilaginibacter polytrichastri]|nr:conjugative transposon protein TraK [Mucilaginibacter polytrichastri]